MNRDERSAVATLQAAREYGWRAGQAMRDLDRAMELARLTGLPFRAVALDHLCQQAWANAKLAAHHALEGGAR